MSCQWIYCLQWSTMAKKKSKIRPGRPRVAAPKYGRLTARITLSELDRIHRVADAAGKTRCQWGSEALLEKLERDGAA